MHENYLFLMTKELYRRKKEQALFWKIYILGIIWAVVNGFVVPGIWFYLTQVAA
jgi:hypothetical protein